MTYATTLVSFTRGVALVLLMSATLFAALFSVARAEVIPSFHSDIVVNEDSSFVVTETITYDFGEENRHGIYRNIRDSHPQAASVWYKTRYIDLSLISVTRDGQPEPYTLESYDGLSVKIGDADRTITGVHTYEIVYTVAGGLAEYSDGVEVYWNVTGDEWPVVIEDVAAKVRTSWGDGLSAEASCYAGPAGSSEPCQNVVRENGVSVFMESYLSPSSQLTVAQRLNFTGPVTVLERVNTTPFLIPLLVVVTVSMWVGVYRWRTKYRLNQSIIAQYEPLPGFKPMFTGVLFDGRLDARDITAGILYLAQQGYIKIRQTTEKVLFFKVEDYEVSLEKSIEKSDESFNDEIASLLFGYVQTQGGVIKLPAIKNDRLQLIRNQSILQKLKSAVSVQMLKDGFVEHQKGSVLTRIGAVLVLVLLAVTVSGLLPAGLFVPLVFGILLVLIFSYERRTEKGYEALDYLKGFKDFLSVTEQERYKFHNAPALSPEQFMEYLPYAIAFGVEKEWAEVFKDIQIMPPGWYQSDTQAPFSAAAFTSSLSSFSTSLSSTGTSGSSGGGSSGGGGGGGGGGSW